MMTAEQEAKTLKKVEQALILRDLLTKSKGSIHRIILHERTHMPTDHVEHRFEFGKVKHPVVQRFEKIINAHIAEMRAELDAELGGLFK